MNKLVWDQIPLAVLKTLLKEDPTFEANKELARRVVMNETASVNYYIGPMSEGLVLKLNHVLRRDSYADLYLFLADPFEAKTGIPHWHRVSLYDARDCNLKSYTARIACRHFFRIANKEKKRSIQETELLDFCDYASLLNCDQPDKGEDNASAIRIKKAYRALCERDQKVLKLLVLDKMSGIDAFPFLESYIHPLAKDGMSSEEIKSHWTLKQKQDAVSLMKGRALKRLADYYKDIEYDN